MPQEHTISDEDKDIVYKAIHKFRDSEKRSATIEDIAKRTPWKFVEARKVINKMVKQGSLYTVFEGPKEYVFVSRKN